MTRARPSRAAAWEIVVKTHFATLTLSIAACAFVSVPRLSAESPQRIYARTWEGKTVVLKRVLYTLVYNERGLLGNVRSGRRDGLTVLTSSRGMYFQFDGRQGKDAV